MRSGRGAPDRACSRRARTACSSCSAANCRTSSGPNRSSCRSSGRTSNSRSDGCRGAMRRRRARPARSKRAMEKSATTPTSAKPVKISAGSTASSSSTRTGTWSRTGRSGTRCFAGRMRCTSARTIRRSACGWSTITATRFSSSATTASGCCRRSANRTCMPPTTDISTGRRSSRGCPTARSSSRTATPTRAS